MKRDLERAMVLAAGVLAGTMVFRAAIRLQPRTRRKHHCPKCQGPLRYKASQCPACTARIVWKKPGAA